MGIALASGRETFWTGVDSGPAPPEVACKYNLVATVPRNDAIDGGSCQQSNARLSMNSIMVAPSCYESRAT